MTKARSRDTDLFTGEKELVLPSPPKSYDAWCEVGSYDEAAELIRALDILASNDVVTAILITSRRNAASAAPGPNWYVYATAGERRAAIDALYEQGPEDEEVLEDLGARR